MGPERDLPSAPAMPLRRTDSRESAGDDVRLPATAVTSRHTRDAGWAWAVDAGVFCTLMLCMGIQRSNGLFFVELQDRFHVSASAVSTVGGTFSAIYSVGAVITMTFVLDVLSERMCILIGVFLMTSAYTLSSLVMSFPVFVFTLGAVSGYAMSMIYGPAFVLLGKYFRRHLTLAQAIANTGVSAGAFVLPFVVRAILDQFSFPAGLLVVGGVLCHMFICAALFRPVGSNDVKAAAASVGANVAAAAADHAHDEGGDTTDVAHDVGGDTAVDASCEYPKNSHQKNSHGRCYSANSQKVNSKSTSKQSETVTVFEAEALKPPARTRRYSESETDAHVAEFHTTVPLHRSLQHLSTKPAQDQKMPAGPDAALRQSTLDRLSSSWAVLSTTPELLCASLSSLNHMPARTEPEPEPRKSHTTTRTTQRPGPRAGKRHGRCGCLHFRMCDRKTCTDLPMWGLVLWQLFGLLTGVMGPAFLPPLAKEKGLSDNEAAFLLTLLGGLDIGSRLMPGVIAHYGLLKPHQMVILALVLQGALCQFLALFNTFRAMVGFCVGFGCLSGVFFSMTQSTVVQFVGVEDFRVTFGFIQLFNGLSTAVGYPTVGALKDISGTYVTSFRFLGVTEFVAASILASLPFLCRLQQKLEAKRDKRAENNGGHEVVPLASALSNDS